MRPGTIAIVILAAGGSRRMGRPKQLLRLRGRTLIRRAVETAIESECAPVVVTLGAHERRVTPELAGLPVSIAHNPDWTRGIGSSLRAGLEELARVPHLEISAAVITLADQPLVTAGDIKKLVRARSDTAKELIASEYAGTQGAPMLISERFFAEAAGLNADEGGRRLLARHPAEVATVPLPSAAFDVDTADDYERLARLGR